jgi:hypothetical protein
LILVGSALGGCAANAGSTRSASPADAGSTPAASGSSPAAAGTATGETSPVPSEPGPAPSSGEATSTAHLRTIGPGDQGHQVVIRVGDRLGVVPAGRAAGWVVTDFPSGVLRLQGSPGAASSHTFLAVAVGEGQLTLTPAGPEARSTVVFTVRIRVLRDTVQPPQP